MYFQQPYILSISTPVFPNPRHEIVRLDSEDCEILETPEIITINNSFYEVTNDANPSLSPI